MRTNITVQYRVSDKFALAVNQYATSVDKRPGDALEDLAVRGSFSTFEQYLSDVDWQNLKPSKAQSTIKGSHSETILISDELAKLLSELGQTATEVIYEFFGLDIPAEYYAVSTDPAMFKVNDLTVLCWQSPNDTFWYCVAPSHPWLCSVAPSRDGAVTTVSTRIEEMLSKRVLSKIELALSRKSLVAYESLSTQKGKTGVTALGSVLDATSKAYGFTSKENADSSYLLACVLTIQSTTANQSSKDWATLNMNKYVFCTEAFEEMVQAQQ